MAAADSRHCEQTLMFTDIVGYSRLMGRNEAMAIDMLGEYRNILLSHIEAQGGQLVECIGDAIFARFDAAASATAAAIAIQQHLQTFNELRDKKLPRLQTRIGLHKGEVALRDNAVFGDTVNIAARLEPLAVADGICISQTVYDEIRYSLSAPAKRLGVQALKNIEQKIRVYLIKPAGINWRDHLHYFLHGLNKKIIAYRYPLTACLLAFIVAGFYFVPRWLVPGYTANYVEIADFQNLMNEKADADYFSAGITEAVRSQLADMRDVYIVDAKEGIHAPIRLEGSVQRLGDNLRIAYRLFRRKDNVQIAGGKLDGTYQDIFILQDRLVGEIARFLADEFGLQNFRPAPLRLTGDVTAYDYYLQGLGNLKKPSSHETIDSAIQYFNTALIHDNKFSLSNTGLCEAYWKKFELSNSVYWLGLAEEHCVLALNQDGSSIRAFRAMAVIYRDMGRYDEAISLLESGPHQEDVWAKAELASVYDLKNQKEKSERLYLQAISGDPNNWELYEKYAYFLTRNGRHDEAIKYYNKVLNVTPEYALVLNNLAALYLYRGDFKQASALFEKSAKVNPNGYVFVNAGTMYYFLHDFNKALEMYEKGLRLEPNNYEFLLNVSDAMKFISGREDEAKGYCFKAMREAKKEIELSESFSRPYNYLARSLACVGNLDEAREAMKKADLFGAETTESLYSNLRMSILESDDFRIRHYAVRLLNLEYSDKLLLADPDFVVLKEPRFGDLFDRTH